MNKVFISYIIENEEQIKRFVKDLKAKGIECWLDKKDIQPGTFWKDAIRHAISNGDFFLACFSEEYCRKKKTFMNDELIWAIDELRLRHIDSKWFIPIKLNVCKIPDYDIGGGKTLSSIQFVDLYKNWDDGIMRLISVIKPSSSIINHSSFNDTLHLLSHQYAGCHLRVLLYSGESFYRFCDPYTSNSFSQITLLTRHWLVEKIEEELWNIKNQNLNIRPWNKYEVMKTLHKNILDSAIGRGLPLKRRFYENSPNLFMYIFGEKAAVYSKYKVFPKGTIAVDINGQRGGSRYKAWFSRIFQVFDTDDVGKKTIKKLIRHFQKYEKSSVSYEEMIRE